MEEGYLTRTYLGPGVSLGYLALLQVAPVISQVAACEVHRALRLVVNLQPSVPPSVVIYNSAVRCRHYLGNDEVADILACGIE